MNLLRECVVICPKHRSWSPVGKLAVSTVAPSFSQVTFTLTVPEQYR